MKQATKAILFSALIYPGAGHIVLKKTKRGIVFITLASASFIVVLNHVISSAQQVVDKILAGEVSTNVMQIRELIQIQQANSATLVVDAAIVILLATWLIGIIDTYRIARLEAGERK